MHNINFNVYQYAVRRIKKAAIVAMYRKTMGIPK